MSVDVEDYFHVSVFDDVVPRSRWEGMESRVSANTTRLLDLFDEFGVRGTFFVLGWVAERHPGSCATSLPGVTRSRRTATGTASSTARRGTSSGRTCAAQRVLEDASGRSVGGYRAPSFSVTAASLWALDVLVEEGHWYDASIFPIRHDRYGIPGRAEASPPSSICAADR
jgi:polysaccharide deacetylase family protein (PEP-CTERM system associated)